MARRFPILLLILTSLACGIRATAQSARPEPAKLGTDVSLSLGHSMLPLYGPWKFQVGDSPIEPATNQPLWVQPDFDDATWETVDLTPAGADNPLVPGWGKRGHSSYAGYAWYRIRVNVNAQPGEKLALAGPPVFDDAYQLFLNGKLLGAFGRFDGKRPKFYYARPMIFPLPQVPEGAGRTGNTEVIAFRFWMSPVSLLGQPDAGGFFIHGTSEKAGAISVKRCLSVVIF